VQDRGITVNFKRNLLEVRPKEKKAIFEKLDKPGTTEVFEVFSFHSNLT
jgi:hypothetical protein